MKKYALTIFTIIIAGLFGVQNASAVSAYDDLLINAEEIYLQESYGDEENISVTWGGILSTECGYTLDYDLPYAVVQNLNSQDKETASKDVYVYQGTSVGQALAWGSYVYVNGTVDYWHITQDDDSYNCNSGSAGSMPVSSPLNESGNGNSIFISTFEPNYPNDYEGEEIPDTYTPPVPPLEYAPNFRVLTGVDYKITVQDQNFNTFDEVPFTCNEGLTPMIGFNIYNNDTSTLVVTDIFSPTVQFTYDLPEETVETEYKIVGKYTCGTEPEDPVFANESDYTFKISGNGALVNSIWEECFNTEAPFIHLESCTSNVETAINMLSFDKIAFANTWEHEDECANLEVLDEWLNVENPQACPMFPEYVRDTVTPFVTFGLGLVTLGFLNNRNSGMYG